MADHKRAHRGHGPRLQGGAGCKECASRVMGMGEMGMGEMGMGMMGVMGMMGAWLISKPAAGHCKLNNAETDWWRVAAPPVDDGGSDDAG